MGMKSWTKKLQQEDVSKVSCQAQLQLGHLRKRGQGGMGAF